MLLIPFEERLFLLGLSSIVAVQVTNHQITTNKITNSITSIHCLYKLNSQVGTFATGIMAGIIILFVILTDIGHAYPLLFLILAQMSIAIHLFIFVPFETIGYLVHWYVLYPVCLCFLFVCFMNVIFVYIC